VRFAAAIMAALAAAALTGCSAGVTATLAKPATSPTASASQAAARRAPSLSPSLKPTPATAPRPKPSALLVAPASAGTLPQTQTLPNTGDTAFRNVVHDFWLAVTTGNPGYAKPAFFPEKAYEQVKAIADPDSDWLGRLWYDFELDVAAVRPLVGQNAKLLRIVVPVQCYNTIGYWHVPGSRVVYEQGGVTRSFGIASFISWRGDWYLIHLGALTRAGAVGVVDDPAAGPGEPGPPGGC
jgi:hypothetical protein